MWQVRATGLRLHRGIIHMRNPDGHDEMHPIKGLKLVEHLALGLILIRRGALVLGSEWQILGRNGK